MSKHSKQSTLDALSKTWNGIVKECINQFSELQDSATRLTLITAHNCGVLNELDNFPALLRATHIEICEHTISSVQKLMFVSSKSLFYSHSLLFLVLVSA